jgi:acyl carrier protein|tara:strand:+ start:1519 stop:1755 length:237 start_codon:yes stop_codon:yes gene_type:complete
MKKIDDRIISALKKTFTKPKIPKKIDNLKIGELKGWDSLGHVNLLLEIEKTFKLKFDSQIFLNLDSIKKIKKELIKLS